LSDQRNSRGVVGFDVMKNSDVPPLSSSEEEVVVLEATNSPSTTHLLTIPIHGLETFSNTPSTIFLLSGSPC